MTAPTLLSCPFCGDSKNPGVTEEFTRGKPTGIFYALCHNCGAKGPSGSMQDGESHTTPESAATAWNARGEVHNVALEASKLVAKRIIDAALPPPASPNIIDLGLSVRATNCLLCEGINTLAQLTLFRESELIRIPNLGRKALNEIKSAVAERSLLLRPEHGTHGTRP